MLNSLISALGSLGASLIGSSISSAGANEVNNATMAFNARMQKEAQAYNTQMYERQLADSRETYEKYQSPQALVKAYESIGLNPAAVLGNLGNGGSPSVPSASGSPTASVGSLQNAGAPFADVLPTAVDAVSKLVDSGVKSSRLAPEIAYIMEQIHGSQLANSYQKLVNFVYGKYGEKKMESEVNELITRSYMQYMTGRHQEALESSEKVTKMILDNKLGMSDVERANYATYYSEFLRGLQLSNKYQEESLGIPTLQKKQIQSDTVRNFALSSYYTALSKTEDALREGSVEMQSLQNDLLTINKFFNGNELQIQEATKDSKIVGVLNALAREKLITEKAAYEARTAYYMAQSAAADADWAGWRNYINVARGVVGCASDALDSFTSLRGVELRRLSAKERNEIQSRFANEYEQRGLHERFPYTEGYGSPFLNEQQFRVPKGQ